MLLRKTLRTILAITLAWVVHVCAHPGFGQQPPAKQENASSIQNQSSADEENSTNDDSQTTSDDSAEPSTDQATQGNRMPPGRALGNSPDDVSRQLAEGDNERIDSTFRAGPLTPLNRLWKKNSKRLKEKLQLNIGMNYTTIYQHADRALPGRRRDAMGGDLDIFGSWHLTGHEKHRPGKLVFDTEGRHANTVVPPANLGSEIGSLWGTTTLFDVQKFTVTQLFWEQGAFEDGWIVRAGRMDPTLIYDGGQFVSDNYAFFSPAFSDTLPITAPGPGFGVSGAYFPNDEIYVYAGIHDANGSPTRAGWDTFFGDGEFFTAVELGYTPNFDQPDAGAYHVTFWHSDARANIGQPHDKGIAMTLEQQFGDEGKYVPFLRYAVSDKGVGNGVRKNLSLGLGVYDVLGKNEDVLGLGWSWGQPSNRSLREQHVFESFYRIVITPHSHITPDIQVIFNPSNAPGTVTTTVFGIRFRTLF